MLPFNRIAGCAFSLFLSFDVIGLVHGAQPLSGGTSWVLLENYSDEFNGSTLDAEKWNSAVSPWGDWTWRPENVEVKGGALRITMQYLKHERNGKQFFYTSGIIRSTQPSLRYGYFEARIKATPRAEGMSPAFWMYKSEPDRWTEIDFVELTQFRGNPRKIDFNTHVFRHPNLSGSQPLREQRTWESPWHPSDGFHVYGCEWNESKILWYVDGKLVYERKNEYWDQPLDLVVSMGLRAPLISNPSEDGFPSTMEVDYVRTWIKGDGKGRN